MAHFLKLIRDDANFRGHLSSLIGRLGVLERMSGDEASKERDQVLLSIMRKCDYNASLLVPYFFPAYPQDKPLSLFNRPFQAAFMDVQVGGYVVCVTGRQSGKTTSLGVRQRTYAQVFPKYRSLYVAPHPMHLKTYANKFRDLEKAFRFQVTDHRFRQNLYYKEYPNGSMVELIRLLLSADDARGKTVDEILIDEAAMFDPEFELELKQTQKASEMPSSYYAGTALTRESFLACKYDESSQGQWFVPTTDNIGKKKWINCSDPEDILRCIQPDGLTCPYTGKILRVETGEFVHKNQEAYDYGYVGYHAPQLIIPEYISSLVKWAEIFTDFKTFSLTKFLREVMGIPTEDGYREISAKDLENICCNTEDVLARIARANRHFYSSVVSGIDWGGSDYNPVSKTKASQTAQVILGVTPERNLDVLHMETWAGMHYRDIARNIAKNHEKFRGNIMVSDDGGGDLYNTFLQETGYVRPEKHLVLKYTVPNSPLMARINAEGRKYLNWYGLNRTESISSLFEAIKRQPSPRIRCYHWGDARRHLMEFLNVYRNMTETDTGSQKFRYLKHGSKCDDIMHAMNFAYVGAKVVMNEPLLDDRAVRDQLRQLLVGTAPSVASNAWSGIAG